MHYRALLGTPRKGLQCLDFVTVNQLVVGSIPTAGASFPKILEIYQGLE
jgi:hypothetical protein